jgi:uncharacterized protein YkwD
MFGGSVAFAAGIAALPKTAAVVINGDIVDLKGYVIEGTHYFQLRDLSAALRPGGKDFGISWDGDGNRIIIDTNRGYDTDERQNPQPLQPYATVTRSSGTPAGVMDKDLATWQDADYTLHENELEAIRLINEERANAGLQPVTISIELCKVARIKAVEMATMGYLSHESPNYGLPKEMLNTFGVRHSIVSENASYTGGTYASGIVWGWMRSEGHKRNLMNPNHKEVGIGVSPDGTGLGYWSLFLIY